MNFKYIVEMMEQMCLDIEYFYHWPASMVCEYSQNFALMIAIGSYFLLHCLLVLCRCRGVSFGGVSYISNPEDISKDDIIGLVLLQLCTICDIMKLENQIPLSFLINNFENVKEALIFNHKSIENFSEVLWNTCGGLPPFILNNVRGNYVDAVEQEPHLMGFLDAFVSQFLQMQIGEKINMSLSQNFKEKLLILVIKICSQS